MNGFIRSLIIGAMLVCFLGCASNQSQNDDLGSDSDNIESAGADQLADANTSSDNSAEQPQQAQDDFADFDNGANASSADQKTDVSSQDSSGTNTAPGDDSDLAIEDELSNTNQQNPPAQAAEAVPPRHRALDHPAVSAKAIRALDTAAGDPRDDADLRRNLRRSAWS